MTLTDFTAALTGAVPNCYPDAAPAGVRPCVVYSVYGSRTVLGDDRNQMDIPKVQLDLLTLSSLDPLLDTVTDVLWELALPYSVQDMSVSKPEDVETKVIETFAKNKTNHKLEFWSTLDLSVNDNCLFYAYGDTLRSYISYKRKSSEDARYYYKSGELATTATEKLRGVAR